MKHIVFIVGSYYPFFSAVGNCIGNIAAEFDQDYEVTVIALKNVIQQEDKGHYRSQDIIRISYRMNDSRIEIDDKLKTAKGFNRQICKMKLLFAKFYRYISTVLAASGCNKELTKAYLEGLERIEKPIDLIIPTCNPFESVKAALMYKAQYPDTVIIPVLFDLFASSVNVNRGVYGRRKHWKENVKLERLMFERSDFVFHVANWTNHIKNCFPEFVRKTEEIEHPLLVHREMGNPKKENNEIHVVYTGVVDTNSRNPKATLEVLSKIETRNVRYDFYSFGSAQNIVNEYALSSNGIIAHGKVNSEKAKEARGNANILLSIGNVDSSQTPSKLIEYVATGKPILHFMQCEDDPVTKLLSRYPLSKIIDIRAGYDVGDIEKFIIDNANKCLNFDSVKMLYHDADPKYIKEQLLAKIPRGGIK